MTEYRAVVGIEGYRVGSDGSVWSCLRQVGHGDGGGTYFVVGDTWRQLACCPNKHGYLRVTLKGRRWRKVHHLVLEAFVGPCPPGLEACHRDGDKSNCALDNLRWDTHQSNLADRKAVGTDPLTHRGWRAQITLEQAREIRALYGPQTGMGPRPKGLLSANDIAKRYGVSRALVSQIVMGKTWRDDG